MYMHSVLLYVRKKEADKNCGIARVSPPSTSEALSMHTPGCWLWHGNASIADRAYTARLPYEPEKNTR